MRPPNVVPVSAPAAPAVPALASVLASAREALAAAESANADRFPAALELLAPAAVIWCSGVGKSGLVARKIAGTLASLGRRAMFLHPVEAMHGDAGSVRAEDVLIAVSQSGHTVELLRLVHELALPTVALTVPGSPLAAVARATMDTSIAHEAGGRLPVTSFTVACALGDALALALAELHGAAVRHPGGNIGAMALPVRRFMLPPPMVAAETRIVDVIPRLGLGAVLVEGGGIFTDGDLRRVVGSDPGALSRAVGELCTRSPVTVGADEPARVALELMERRASQIAVLPVVEHPTIGAGDVGDLTHVSPQYVGIVRLHDLVRAGFGV